MGHWGLSPASIFIAFKLGIFRHLGQGLICYCLCMGVMNLLTIVSPNFHRSLAISDCFLLIGNTVPGRCLQTRHPTKFLSDIYGLDLPSAVRSLPSDLFVTMSSKFKPIMVLVRYIRPPSSQIRASSSWLFVTMSSNL